MLLDIVRGGVNVMVKHMIKEILLVHHKLHT